MVPQSVLVTQPALAVETLVLACSQLFDHRVSKGIDGSPRKLSDTEKFLSIIDAMRSPGAPASLPSDLLKHTTFSALVIADERDMIDIMQICSGMPTMFAETKARGMMATVITGTLDQWRDAVSDGCHSRVSHEVRAGFNQIHSLFVSAGLGAIWKGYKQTNDDSGTFLLTHEC